MSSSKNKIIYSSRDLFERFGYQKTTLTDIAKSIGKVKSAVYYYFSGKEAIFAELVKTEAKEFLEKLITEVEKVDEPIDQIRAYINCRVDLMEAVAKRYHFLKSEFFELMPIVEENRKEQDIREVQYLTAIMKKVNSETEFEVNNPSFTAKLLMQNIKGLEIQMFVTDQVQAHNENREAFINFLLHGVLIKTK